MAEPEGVLVFVPEGVTSTQPVRSAPGDADVFKPLDPRGVIDQLNVWSVRPSIVTAAGAPEVKRNSAVPLIVWSVELVKTSSVLQPSPAAKCGNTRGSVAVEGSSS